MTLALLTTNNFSEQLKEIVSWLEQAGYIVDMYYTGKEGIKIALSRYEDLIAQEKQQAREKKERKESVGQNAIQQILDLHPKRWTLDPGEFLLQIIKYSFQAHASDMHFQVQSKEVELRLRIDGVMKNICTFNLNEYMAYLQKIKMRGGMKMNVNYLPQDGRMSFEVTLADEIHKRVDVRINLLPGLNKLENIVMRFLDSTFSIFSFEELWFKGDNKKMLENVIRKNEGMIFVTWPTGSWKTTTLYTMIQNLKQDDTNKIITLEDPIEYTMPGIEQSQVNPEKWYTFEKWLEAILRHDPDIILVWETRSTETAKTALNAALTWHLVLSTLHTNSALEAIPRLLMMGVESYLLAPSLQAIVAQRLVRKLCSYCKQKRNATPQEDQFINDSLKEIMSIQQDIKISYSNKVSISKWCDHCNGTWYIGRLAVVEIIPLTATIREKIVDGQYRTNELLPLVRKNWYLTMYEDALLKMLDDETSIEELMRLMWSKIT